MQEAKARNVYKNFSGVDYDDFHLLFYDDFSTDKNGMEKSYEKRVRSRGRKFVLSIIRNVHILELLERGRVGSGYIEIANQCYIT